jgi:hypothetical protein
MPVIELVSRDIEGNANGTNAIEAVVLPDGRYQIGLGNLPGLADALPGDVKVITTTTTPVAVANIETDEVNQYITFTTE